MARMRINEYMHTCLSVCKHTNTYTLSDSPFSLGLSLFFFSFPPSFPPSSPSLSLSLSPPLSVPLFLSLSGEGDPGGVFVARGQRKRSVTGPTRCRQVGCTAASPRCSRCQVYVSGLPRGTLCTHVSLGVLSVCTCLNTHIRCMLEFGCTYAMLQHRVFWMINQTNSWDRYASMGWCIPRMCWQCGRSRDNFTSTMTSTPSMSLAPNSGSSATRSMR